MVVVQTKAFCAKYKASESLNKADSSLASDLIAAPGTWHIVSIY